jgi:hypothetical protein
MSMTARAASKMDMAPPHHPQAAPSTRWRTDLGPPSPDLAHRRLTAVSRSGPDLAPATRAAVSRRCHPCGHLQPRTPNRWHWPRPHCQDPGRARAARSRKSRPPESSRRLHHGHASLLQSHHAAAETAAPTRPLPSAPPHRPHRPASSPPREGERDPGDAVWRRRGGGGGEGRGPGGWQLEFPPCRPRERRGREDQARLGGEIPRSDLTKDNLANRN